MTKDFKPKKLNKRIAYYFILFAFLFGAKGCCTPGLISSLPVTLHPQETSNWCWAASGQMVMDYLGHGVSQCTQANNRFVRTDCCNIDLCPSPTEAPQYASGNCINCACPGWPEFEKYGFTFKTTTWGIPLSWADVKKQTSNLKFCKNKPFAFSWGWIGGGGHMMVAKGYLTLADVNYVAILDPWPPCQGNESIITYDFFNADPTDHTHWRDYYDVTYTGGK